eukprot:TRINITY_DN3148_c0_g1_i1.p1 TRINITY_DN3148_c0_g1~~TRINITY_DN3148_c0_g1_i1.p1  ORF type:complete len:134 (+),score=20.74 TRINITY_DN3148_c0_g1_i1:61-462(+)
MAAQSHYETLGCAPNATIEEIRAQYLALSRLHHPDKSNAGDAMFKLVAEAWRVLSDKDLRCLYDAEQQANDRQQLPYHDTILLSDMDLEDDIYYYDCRCGGEYVLTEPNLNNSSEVVPCDCCTLAICVEFNPS